MMAGGGMVVAAGGPARTQQTTGHKKGRPVAERPKEFSSQWRHQSTPLAVAIKSPRSGLGVRLLFGADGPLEAGIDAGTND